MISKKSHRLISKHSQISEELEKWSYLPILEMPIQIPGGPWKAGDMIVGMKRAVRTHPVIYDNN